jgi:hypothetical protein
VDSLLIPEAIYSLSALSFMKCLQGVLPWMATRQVISSRAGLARIINQALEKDRDKRYQSADEMFADLKSLQPEIDKHLLFPATIRRHYRLVFAALTTLIFVGILALYPFRSRGGSIDSIAVLPFSSEGGADLEFLADG